MAFRQLSLGQGAAPAALSRTRSCARSRWRRVLIHRSTFADLANCVIGLATPGAIIGWAVVSTSWISDGVAASLTPWLGPGADPHAPDVGLNAERVLALFFAYRLFL